MDRFLVAHVIQQFEGGSRELATDRLRVSNLLAH
jgi:hypothetical protein